MRIRWRGLELPNRVVSDRSTLTDTYGKFMAEPFEDADSFRASMTAAEQELFDTGQLVVRHSTMAGSNMCAVFHPLNYVHDVFARGLQVVEYSPARLGQDVALLRKPQDSS